LIDADALAAQGRHAEAQAQLEKLFANFPEHRAVVPGNQLLAWSYAQQGDDDRAIAIEERMLRRYATSGSTDQLATARLNIGHVRFNQRRYQDAAKEYEAYLQIEEDRIQLSSSCRSINLGSATSDSGAAATASTAGSAS
jgi:tetratricopeptide (TPR) repeat protein